MAQDHYNAIVVGSGFGGSVMAYRLAEAGLTVSLLERGRPYPPNSFPRSPYKMKDNVWDPSEGLYGLFNVWAFHGMNSIVSAGLGGGSLIYANVLLRKDEKWFVKEGWRDGVYEYWPVSYADLELHYENVEKIIRPQKYPYNTAKTQIFESAAVELGIKKDWSLVPLAVTFANEGKPAKRGEHIQEEVRNLHDADRSTCRLCGECDIGCNYGSKNTLDFNYLTLAARSGAKIQTLTEVRSFRPRTSHPRFEIDFVRHDLSREGHKFKTRDLPLETATADYLILAAGTLGTNYLLLKNRDAFPALSLTAGRRFSGNGDYLAFVLKCRDESVSPPSPRVVDAAFGPVITSTIRIPDEQDGGDGPGFYVQDAGYPEFINWIVETAQTPSVLARGAAFVAKRLAAWLHRDPRTNIAGQLRGLLGLCEVSAGSMPLLCMGRDRAEGRAFLREGDIPGQVFLELDWPEKKSREYFRRVVEMAGKVANKMGGEFLQDPLTEYLNQLITVHPLGGCAMGRNSEEGVVNSYGQVFGYPGFYVADGSVMPGPVGANPSLTIAALSDRFAENILEQEGKL